METVGRTLILLNPHGISLRRSGALDSIYSHADGRDVVLVETRYAGHAGEYCRHHAARFDKVVAVGGDGLLMDVVNGSLDSGAAVAPLPAGTASDFVKAAPGYPATLEAILASRDSTQVDLGRVTFSDGGVQCFLTEAGVGLDAACLRYVPRWLRPISAKRAYDVGALRAVLWARPFAARAVLDGDPLPFARFLWIAVSNTPYSGDGMPIAPDARIDDGLLRVFALGEATRREILGNFLLLRRGKHIHHPKSAYRACRRIELETDADLDMCFDGDLVLRTPRKWEILPGRLRLVAPAH